MKRAWRTWWMIYASCAIVVAAALLIVTVSVLRLEQREFAARAEARHQGDLRIALWRMDSWIAPQLAQESARPYFEYAAYYAPERAYTRLLSEIQPKEVQTPSPLLTYESELFPLHFQVDQNGSFTSPQAPTGNQRDLAEATLIEANRLEEKSALLTRLAQQVSPVRIENCTVAGMSQLAAQIDFFNEMNTLPPIQAPAQQEQTDQLGQQTWADPAQQSLKEYAQRAQTSNVAQQPQKFISPFGDSVEIGPFTPAWLQVGPGALDSLTCEQHLLVFVRRVMVSGTVLHQGLVADWPRIRDRLLQEVEDLFPAAELHPLRDDGSALRADGMRMAIVPVTLEAPAPEDPAIGMMEITPMRATLSLVWLAALIAVLATGVTLRSSISYGERRHRFASAVTHELRTPLTTFRMYSEMLAENMVTDEAKRREYLRALRTESNRLSALVENVLAYARLEQGRAAGHLETIAADEMLERIRPALMRRSEEASLHLDVEADAAACDVTVEVDVEAVGQIMLNLVDNVCKYAAAEGSTGAAQVDLIRENGAIRLSVTDHGPGVPAELRRAIFQPFDRGTKQPGDTTPGVGLGLALSRGLARQMGGDLTVNDRSGGEGARFTLTIPIQP